MTRWERYNADHIEIRDGYLDGTALCQANKKLIADWLPERNQRTQELCEEIALNMGFPILSLIRRGRGQGSHTYVHPLLWPSLGQWCSRTCELWVNTLLVTRYMADFNRAALGEPVALDPESLRDQPDLPLYPSSIVGTDPMGPPCEPELAKLIADVAAIRLALQAIESTLSRHTELLQHLA